MVLGWDDAIYAGVALAGTAASAHSASAANRANAQINSHNAEQAWQMYHDTRQYDINAAAEDRQFNSAEAEKARLFQQNETNKSLWFGADQANIARAWEKNMSDTSYQRAVGDMQAAGLNPMLAYSQGGASTPNSPSPSGFGTGAAQASTGGHSGSVGTVPGKIPMQQTLGSAAQLASVGLDLMGKSAEVKKINAEADRTAQTMKQEGLTFDDRWTKVRQEVEQGKVSLRVRLEAEELEKDAKKAEYKLRSGELTTQELHQEYQRINNELERLGLPKAEAYADYYKSPVGKAEPYIGLGADMLSSATGVFRAMMSGRGPKSYSRTYFDRDGNPSGGMSHDYAK